MNASMFGIISIVCFIGCIIFAALSVFLFFYLDIKTAYGIYTGKNFLKGVGEIRKNDKKASIYKQTVNDEIHTEQIFTGIDKPVVGLAHPSKQLQKSSELKNEETTVLKQTQTTTLNDETIILGDDTILLQPTIDLDDEEKTNIHFQIIEEIKIIHSNHIIEERGIQE